MLPASVPVEPLLTRTLLPACSALWTLFQERFAPVAVAVKVVVPEAVDELTAKSAFGESVMFQANKMRSSRHSTKCAVAWRELSRLEVWCIARTLSVNCAPPVNIGN